MACLVTGNEAALTGYHVPNHFIAFPCSLESFDITKREENPSGLFDDTTQRGKCLVYRLAGLMDGGITGARLGCYVVQENHVHVRDVFWIHFQYIFDIFV